MKIALDARSLSSTMVGVGNVVFHLVIYLLEQGYECILFVGQEKELPRFPQSKNLTLVPVPGDTGVGITRYKTENRIFKKLIKEHNPDLFHSTDNLGIPSVSIPTILTIHDLIPLSRPENMGNFKKLLYRYSLKQSAKRASIITTISEFTQEEIEENLEVSKENTRVIYNGFSHAESDEKKPLTFKIPKSYILYVGGITPRKNILNTLKGYAQFCKNQEDTPDFIIVGKISDHYKEEFESYKTFVKKSKIENKVIFTGFISDEELTYLRKRAVFSVYISQYEGFGLPILESMAYGVPVITSDTTAMPEIAGNAALLVDPFHVDEIANAMKQLSTDTDLHNQYTSLGKKRTQDFSWKKMSEQYIDVYKSVLK